MDNEKKQKNSRKWILGGVAIAAVILLGAVMILKTGSGGMPKYMSHKGKPSQINKPAERQKEFVIGSNDIPGAPDVWLQSGSAARQICELVYEPLVSVSASKEVHPVLAEDVIFSQDGLTAEVTLKEKVFSDGSPVTAQDVLESYRLLNGADSQNPLKGTMSAIEGMQELKNGENDGFGIQVLTENRLRFQFRQVSVSNLEALTVPVVKLADGTIYGLGTGGYQLDGMQGFEEVHLSRNPKGSTELPYEEIRFINATRQKIEQSITDFSVDAVQVGAEGIGQTLKESGSYDLYTYPAGGRAYLAFAPDAAPAVRRTVNAVFDGEAFCREMEQTAGEAYVPVSALVSPSYEGKTMFGRGEKPEKPVEMLQQERGEAKLNLLIDGSIGSRARFQILAAQFEKHGVELEAVIGDSSQEGIVYDFTFLADDSRSVQEMLLEGRTEEEAQELRELLAKQLNEDYRKVYEMLESQAGEALPAVPVGVQAGSLAVLSDCRNPQILEILMK